jgi:hypothetical protein
MPVTVGMQVKFIDNQKKAREALSQLMDVSNLERCGLAAHTGVCYRSWNAYPRDFAAGFPVS